MKKRCDAYYDEYGEILPRPKQAEYSPGPIGRRTAGSFAENDREYVTPKKKPQDLKGEKVTFDNEFGNRLRAQKLNMHSNVPGQNRKMVLERELYNDFKYKYGIEKMEDSHLIFSPEADFRRKQIYKFVETGKDRPGFCRSLIDDYGQQINKRNNENRARRQH